MRMATLVKYALIVMCSLSGSAYAHCTWRHPGHCAGDAGKAVEKGAQDVGKAAEKAGQDVGHTAEKAVQDAGNAAQKAVQDVGKTAEKAGQDIGANVEIAAQDIGKNAEKAVRDIAQNLEKAGKDTEAETSRAGQNAKEAIDVSARYLERQAQGVGNTLSDAEVRLREGKVVDALWHAAIDPIRYTEKNAAQAALESSLLRAVGETAASAYGGPQGAAAYAAWLTYRETGDPDLALRVGIITGASSYALGKAGGMPNATSEQIVKKAIVTGAIGGTAVAAAGGNEAAIKDGFLKAGAMVVVQDGFKKYTTHRFDPKASNGIAYCMTTNPAVGCQPVPAEAITSLDERGNITGVDMSKLGPEYSHVGIKSPEIGFGNEQLPAMKAISQIPGMNAMAVFHDTWAINWNMDPLTTKLTIVPAIAITYTGTGAPYYELLRRTTINEDLKNIDGSSPLNVAINSTSVVFKKADIQQSAYCKNGPNAKAFAVEKTTDNDLYKCRVIVNADDGATTPWIAHSEEKFCEGKAKELLNELTSSGWECFASTGISGVNPIN